MTRLLVLLRQRIRRDRLQLSLWIVGIALLTYASIAAVFDTYGEEQRPTRDPRRRDRDPDHPRVPRHAERHRRRRVRLLPALRLARPHGRPDEHLPRGRDTRTEEEQGRAEAIGATPAGRILPTTATVVHGVLANVALGLLVALALIATGLDPTGPFVWGRGRSRSSGIAFLAFGLFAAQLFRTSRGANGLSVAFALAAYLLRGIGDAAGTPSEDLLHVTPAWPSRLSPIGYGQFTGAFVQNDLTPAPHPARVRGRVHRARPRPAGPCATRARASWPAAPAVRRPDRCCSSSFGLAWRLEHARSCSRGPPAASPPACSRPPLVRREPGRDGRAPQILETAAPRDRQRGHPSKRPSSRSSTPSWASSPRAARSRWASAPARSRRTAPPSSSSARPVPRLRWLLEYWIVGIIVIVIVLGASALAGIARRGQRRGSESLTTTVLEAALAQLPARLVFLGLTLLVFAFLPRATIAVGWTAVGVAAILGTSGDRSSRLPDRLVALSPFHHSPVPAGGEDRLDGRILDARHRSGRRRGRGRAPCAAGSSRAADEGQSGCLATSSACGPRSSSRPRSSPPPASHACPRGSSWPCSSPTRAASPRHELGEQLSVSAAAISGAVRYLQPIGILHRVAAGGQPSRPVGVPRRRLVHRTHREEPRVRGHRRPRRQGRRCHRRRDIRRRPPGPARWHASTGSSTPGYPTSCANGRRSGRNAKTG